MRFTLTKSVILARLRRPYARLADCWPL